MITLFILFSVLPSRESIIYQTIDKGREGTMNIDAIKDSGGYHAVYTWEDRVIDIVFDSITMATRSVIKTIGDRTVLRAEQKENFEVEFNGGRHSYREKHGVYDRHAAEFALRGFEYTDDFKTTIRFHVPEFMVINADVTVLGTETVTCPVGIAECWKVEMKPKVLFISISLYFWIEKNYPHRFFKYSDTKGDHSILLIKYDKTD
ncbi:hypothetical protein JXB22_06075 [candidate division WOR-3 bacterium]|nr:hypothetical protein [candidate division WOR-3 bacterium]